MNGRYLFGTRAILLEASFSSIRYTPQVSYYSMLWFCIELACIIYKLSLIDHSRLLFRSEIISKALSRSVCSSERIQTDSLYRCLGVKLHLCAGAVLEDVIRGEEKMA